MCQKKQTNKTKHNKRVSTLNHREESKPRFGDMIFMSNSLTVCMIFPSFFIIHEEKGRTPLHSSLCGYDIILVHTH